MAVVREKGYAHWEGALVERRFPWLPIARTGIRLAFRKKGFKFAFAGAFLPAFFFLVMLYISERVEDFRAIIQSNRELLSVDPHYFRVVLTSGPVLFTLILVLAFAAAGLIAEDLKHNSLQLYFARPIGKGDYVLGKLAVVAFFVLLLTALPWLLLVVFKLVFAGSFAFLAAYPWLPLSILGYAALLTVYLGAYVLLLSASSTNTRYVIVLIFGVHYFSDVLAEILKGIFRNPYTVLFSLPANLRQAGAALFGDKLPYAIPAVWSFLVLAAVCGLAAAVLERRVRSVEVIK
jgi:ABC-type transport system involved in multi-copper enzyme maturation permease subunit